FLCSSDTPLHNNALAMGSANPASNSYAANAGWPSRTSGYNGERATPGEFNGVIALVNPSNPGAWQAKGKVRPAQIIDGLSNTALLAERLIQNGNSPAEIRNYDSRLESFHITDATRTLPQMDAACSAAATHSDVPNSSGIGRNWS